MIRIEPASAGHHLLVPDVTFRPLAVEDLPLLARWLTEDHVRDWWRDPAEMVAVEEKYLPRIRGSEATQVFVISWRDTDIGIIQRYRFSDHGDWAATVSGADLAFPAAGGIDYLIGERHLTGRGIGTAAIERFSAQLFSDFEDVETIVVTPQRDNVASCRALEKAGYDLVWVGDLESDDPSDSGISSVYILRRDS